MNENAYIEKLKSYCLKKLNRNNIIRFEEISDSNFVVEYQENDEIIQIVVRGLYNTDFEIFSMTLGGNIYFDYVFYGSNGEIKFPPEAIIIDWKYKFDNLLILYENRLK